MRNLHTEAQLIDPRTLAYVDHVKVSALARLGERSGAWDVQIVIDDPRARGKASFRVDISD